MNGAAYAAEGAAAADPAFGLPLAAAQALRAALEAAAGLQRAWVFGSRARGDHRPRSDLDLALEAPDWGAAELVRLKDALRQLPIVHTIDLVLLDGATPAELRTAVERDRKLFWQRARGQVDDESFGALELKPFQRRVLACWRDYLDTLSHAQQVAQTQERRLEAWEDAADLLRQARNFPLKAWEALRAAGKLPPATADHVYRERWTGEERDARAIPNVCFKVPTGGGKTLLAAAAVARALATYYRRHTGIVLWIVPNEAIYRQTRKALTDNDHPYRQLLNVAGAGRVKVLEKHSPLTRLDAESHLVVLLLMLQSAARQSKETLRLFRDRGDVHGFFPGEHDLDGHWRLLQQVRNLDVYAPLGTSQEDARRTRGSVIKDSLGNVLRAWRPLVVIDEGHHGYTEMALATIDGFNPSLVLELSATPRVGKPEQKQGANLLVDVRGRDLEAAEMIKLPINVDVRPWPDWKSCLAAAVEKLRALDRAAQQLNAQTLRYIRPILLVQVERTGREQRDSGLIHADDARAHLRQLGFGEAEIAEKSSEKDELKQPENLDLLSPATPVRAIITKQALQEGWDCPFAYVLCALAAGRQPAALTQLIGRILRQPQAAKTPIDALNECWVYCNDAATGVVVGVVKRSLEDEGMGDLAGGVRVADGSAVAQRRLRKRPPALQSLRIFLPRVSFDDGSGRRELAYDSDVLGGIDWAALDPAALLPDWAPDAQGAREAVLRMGLEVLESGTRPQPAAAQVQEAPLDRARIVRALLDLVPNPWQLWEWLAAVLRDLAARGYSERQLGGSAASLIDALRKSLAAERDRLAEARFERLVAAGQLRFSLLADTLDYELPYEIEEEVGAAPKVLLDEAGQPLAKALLQPVYTASFDNGAEASFACYLDGQAALRWWHRNVARSQYGLQGWKRDKVYPDFVFAQVDRDGADRLVVLETKGLHLQGAADTEYKRQLLRRLTELFRDERLQKAGELELVAGQRARLSCDLVLSDAGWQGLMAQRYFGATPGSGV